MGPKNTAAGSLLLPVAGASSCRNVLALVANALASRLERGSDMYRPRNSGGRITTTVASGRGAPSKEATEKEEEEEEEEEEEDEGEEEELLLCSPLMTVHELSRPRFTAAHMAQEPEVRM